MELFEAIQELLNLGETGVGIAQIITALNPASWWASGILGLIGLLLAAITGGTAE